MSEASNILIDFGVPRIQTLVKIYNTQLLIVPVWLERFWLPDSKVEKFTSTVAVRPAGWQKWSKVQSGGRSGPKWPASNVLNCPRIGAKNYKVRKNTINSLKKQEHFHSKT